MAPAGTLNISFFCDLPLPLPIIPGKIIPLLLPSFPSFQRKSLASLCYVLSWSWLMFCLPLSADAPVFLCSSFCLQLEAHKAAEEQIDFVVLSLLFIAAVCTSALIGLPKVPVLLNFLSLKLFSSGISPAGSQGSLSLLLELFLFLFCSCPPWE